MYFATTLYHGDKGFSSDVRPQAKFETMKISQKERQTLDKISDDINNKHHQY